MMSREIKFRAWVNTDDGDEMVMLDKLNLDNGLWFNYTEKHINEHISLMQFTGLTDKNGKEIYEGDVLATGIHFKCPVTFSDGCFQLKSNEQQGNSHLTQGRAERLSIIGNIHENPELLK